MKQYSVLSVAIAAALVVTCAKSPTGPGENAGALLTLTTTASSPIATILRIPDKAVYKSGDTVKVVVTTNSGYTFTGWSGDTVTTANLIIFAMKTNKSIYAHFKKSFGNTVFSVVTSATNGSIILTPAGGVYDSGATVMVKARADYGYTFSGWTEGLLGADTLDTFGIVKDVVLAALFSIDPNAVWHTLHISPTLVYGKITLSPPGISSGNGYKYIPGTSVTITAVADSGYQLAGWGGDYARADSSATSLSSVMDSDRAITATFIRIPPMTWTIRKTGVTNGLLSIAWTGNQFVAVGKLGTIISSQDVENWTMQTSGTTNDLYGVAWAQNQFVAVGSSGIICTSPDAVTWTKRESGTTNDLRSITWMGPQAGTGKFVAVGGNIYPGDMGAIVLFSTDGNAWTIAKTNISSTTYGLNSVIWTGSALMAVGDQLVTAGGEQHGTAAIFTSSDGYSWTHWNLSYQGQNDENESVIWNGALYVAVGRNGKIFTSPDAQQWTTILAGYEFENSYAVVWTGSQFIAAETQGLIKTSPTGAKWTDKTTDFSGDLTSMIMAGKQVVSATSTGAIITSP